MKQIWHEAKLRGRGYANASSILEYARKSVGIKDGADASRQAVKWFVSRIIELDGQLSDIENKLNERCMEIPHAKNILAISGIGENILSGILAEMGDISRFDDVKEIQKLSGLGLVACSSGKHTERPKWSQRTQTTQILVIPGSEVRQWHIRRNLRNFMFTIRQGSKIR